MNERITQSCCLLPWKTGVHSQVSSSPRWKPSLCAGASPPRRVPLVCASSPIRIRKVVRIFITFSGLPPACCAIFCARVVQTWLVALPPGSPPPRHVRSVLQLAVFRHRTVRLLLDFLSPALGSSRTGVFRLQVWALLVFNDPPVCR